MSEPKTTTHPARKSIFIFSLRQNWRFTSTTSGWRDST
ncbi:hypothetical protein EC991775_0452, partial [Escherichia coli 99.1775]